ncbi:hypothetical protein AVEN_100329-1 [Araneus ventricosus]|uniref:MULE transposase domain-containing protein n=1 Tax=Araneus ventricosus TaxID=182803 RepID=A0A4Y2TH35_ARAVE|nr:hypothetical protein AVEN_80573-1 [Araneus ventricosus]GBN99985.1 hypothetical protein AVEN_100329-1 [Araneus ventricosus]
MDFEVAAIMGAKIVFPTLDIKDCNFHFKQYLWRQVQSIGLAAAYKCNTEIRLSTRMCAALAFLPEEDIDDAWIKIQEDSSQNFLLTKFYDYFVEQWLENSTITVSKWNCFKRLHRTNNIIEGQIYGTNVKTNQKPSLIAE